MQYKLNWTSTTRLSQLILVQQNHQISPSQSLKIRLHNNIRPCSSGPESLLLLNIFDKRILKKELLISSYARIGLGRWATVPGFLIQTYPKVIHSHHQNCAKTNNQDDPRVPVWCFNQKIHNKVPSNALPANKYNYCECDGLIKARLLSNSARSRTHWPGSCKRICIPGKSGVPPVRRNRGGRTAATFSSF